MIYLIELTKSLTVKECLWCIRYIENKVGKKLELSLFTKNWLDPKYTSNHLFPYLGYDDNDIYEEIAGFGYFSPLSSNEIVVNQFIPTIDFNISIF